MASLKEKATLPFLGYLKTLVPLLVTIEIFHMREEKQKLGKLKVEISVFYFPLSTFQ